ncbi:MAG: epoxyqueuosine reductase QueH [Alphaproteobacteria bacterium]|nr:epoxyqueuosine reductase QueH [Alphaproteobacteria bacterium]
MIKLPEKNKKLLLHACCAPCCCAIAKELKNSGIDFTVFFYNPNIFPSKEYEKRKQELIRYCKKIKVPLIIAEDEKSKKQWEEAVRGLELQPERGKRCCKCINHRLYKTAKYASKNDFDIISSTLSISKFKDFIIVTNSGKEAVKEFKNVDFWAQNWREIINQEEPNKISREENFYRQRYCGCFYSIGDALK